MNQLPNLPYLIRFGQATFRLEVDNLFNVFFREDVMASPSPFIESHRSHNTAQLIEAKTLIAAADENFSENIADAAHSKVLVQLVSVAEARHFSPGVARGLPNFPRSREFSGEEFV